jgi:hypothetical protein
MLAIIDGDILCYNACKPRWEKKAKIVDNTSFVALDADGKRLQFEFTKDEDTKYLEESWDNFKTDLDKLLDTTFASEYLMAVKGVDNYRDRLYPEYKANRHKDPSKANNFVPTIRELAVFEGYAVFAHGREADDYLKIWANEARRVNQEYVICSIDKDLRCIPGKHYLMHKKEFIEISDFEAKKFFYEQLLKGDPTDNIPGLPGIGPVKAQSILADCKTEQEMQELIIDFYIRQYDDSWENYLLSNGKMLYLQDTKNTFFNLAEWPVAQELRCLKG